MAEQEFSLPVSEEEYESSGSKFIAFTDDNGNVVPSGAWGKYVGKVNYRNLELGMPDWDTPGQSIKFPTTIIDEGPDKGKEDKLSAGVTPKGIWKLKEITQAVLSKDLEMKVGSDKKKHPNFKPADYFEKKAVGVYEMTVGKKGGAEDGAVTYYPKLTSFMPAGSKVNTESLA